MNKVTETILESLGYTVVHPANEFHQLELHGTRFKQTFANAESAWAFAEHDLTFRTHRVDPRVQVSGPDFQAEAQKLGFEVTVMPSAPKHGWKNRDLDVCSLRHDYPTAEDAWRAAALWARRFPSIWKE